MKLARVIRIELGINVLIVPRNVIGGWKEYFEELMLRFYVMGVTRMDRIGNEHIRRTAHLR